MVYAAQACDWSPGGRCGPGPGVRRGGRGRGLGGGPGGRPRAAPAPGGPMWLQQRLKGLLGLLSSAGPAAYSACSASWCCSSGSQALGAAGGGALQPLPWPHGDGRCRALCPSGGGHPRLAQAWVEREAVPLALECRLWWPTAFWPWTWSPTGCG